MIDSDNLKCKRCSASLPFSNKDMAHVKEHGCVIIRCEYCNNDTLIEESVLFKIPTKKPPISKIETIKKTESEEEEILDNYVLLTEAAREYDTTQKELRKAIEAEELTKYKFNNRVYLDREEVEDWLIDDEDDDDDDDDDDVYVPYYEPQNRHNTISHAIPSSAATTLVMMAVTIMIGFVLLGNVRDALGDATITSPLNPVVSTQINPTINTAFGGLQLLSLTGIIIAASTIMGYLNRID